MNSNTPNDMDEAVSPVSQVTPNKRHQQHVRKGQFVVLVLLCSVIVFVMFLPGKKGNREVIEARESTQNDATLAQNLELLNQLRANAARSPVSSAVNHERSGMHPPKLRTHRDVGVSKEMMLRMNASTSFEIEVAEPTGLTDSSIEGGGNAANNTLAGHDANSQFLNGQSDISSVSAKRLPHPNLTVPAGEMIPATLETAVNSDLPGMVRAITTRDVYSLLGSNILIPRASTLVGQFNSSVTDGQTRVMVVWDRVQMANGVIVTLDSPGTDRIGRAGQGADFINRHFFERFGTSALLSVLGAYTALGGVGNQNEFNSASQYRMAVSNSFQQASGQTLEGSVNIGPTISIHQGAKINVFVAHDLDFHSVGAARATRENAGGVWK